VTAEEAERGLEGETFYNGFDARVQRTLSGFRAWLAEAKAEGRRIGAYGAAAKGNTLLNAAGVKAADILAWPIAARPSRGGCCLAATSGGDAGGAAGHAARRHPDPALEHRARDRGLPARGGFRGRLLIAVPEMGEVAA
jgi:hypothetical protein